MPEMTTLGWFHTTMGVIAILSGGFTLYKYREITLQHRSGLIYLVTTLITATTALAIYQRGEFGPGHALAVLTLAALAVGTLAATTALFGKWARYVRAISYSATLLFHSVPAVTDGLLRLPVGNPVLSSIQDPVLLMCYLGLLVLFLVGITLQFRWIHRHQH
ncbi:MAG: hypothetical protein OEM63_04400 [Gammaproteobacteria bacterium]|nr:hypothetical protein [Gammaproteobacteria bacterium]